MQKKQKTVKLSITLPNGKRKYVYGRTREEAEAKINEVRLLMGMGINVDDDTTVGELIKLWYDSEVKSHVRPETDETYRALINKYVMPRIAAMRVNEVQPSHIRAVMAQMNGMSRARVGIVLRCLRETFALAEENRMILRSPVLSRIKNTGESGESRHAITPEEEAAVLEAVKGNEAMYRTVWLMLATGLRLGEALALPWSHVDLEHATLRVDQILVGDTVQERTKTAAGAREVPIPFDLRDAMIDWKREPAAYVLHPLKNGRDGYTKSTFARAWKKVQELCGPDGSAVQLRHQLTPHVLRHTYCTRCFEAGMDIKEVQYLMGHATPDITLKVYTDYCVESRKDATFDAARKARISTTFIPRRVV